MTNSFERYLGGFLVQQAGTFCVPVLKFLWKPLYLSVYKPKQTPIRWVSFEGLN